MMVNTLVAKRLEGIRDALKAVHISGHLSSSATQGTEREHFLNSLLREVFPPPYRFGSGDIVDRYEQPSGQVDIVVEYPFLPSLPSSCGGPRLYLAEGVAAVVEVKSDLRKQWREVQKASIELRKLTRSLTGVLNQIGDLTPDIPYFVVGYAGWKTLKPLIERIKTNSVDGILVIDSGLYASSSRFGDDDQRRLELEGDQALWGIVISIHRALTRVQTTDFGLEAYLR